MERKQRAAIFLYNETFDIHVYNLLTSLTELYSVDCYCFDQNFESNELVDIKKVQEKVNLVNYSYQSTFYINTKNRISWKFLRRPAFMVKDIARLINKRKQRYHLAIGIEKRGLALMGNVKLPGARKFYYSLELYTAPPAENYYHFKKIRQLEKRFHSKCDVTIIQDSYRKAAIAEYNKVHEKMKWVYFPVSIKGSTVHSRTDYLHKMHGIEKSKKIVLNFGMISERRDSDEVAKSLSHLPDQYQPLFHGYGYSEELLKAITSYRNIIFSDRLIDESELDQLISSAYIGISIYNNRDLNNKFTILSSERNARYCKCGVPFVCLYNESAAEVYDTLPYFEMVKEISQIPAAVDKIHRNYDEYSRNAYIAFDRYYSFDKNFTAIIKQL